MDADNGAVGDIGVIAGVFFDGRHRQIAIKGAVIKGEGRRLPARQFDAHRIGKAAAQKRAISSRRGGGGAGAGGPAAAQICLRLARITH